ncbi:hypothetical protein SI62_23915 [Salmonella enterica]|uniref:hypothetical protein n=1 Tax=Salmonella enterica TaxID=28901 RepID=UPI0009B13262|nr:hypothetical protein [Salmonella enterica]EAY6136467.1 hypothetical protein [Salmonella enterica]
MNNVVKFPVGNNKKVTKSREDIAASLFEDIVAAVSKQARDCIDDGVIGVYRCLAGNGGYEDFLSSLLLYIRGINSKIGLFSMSLDSIPPRLHDIFNDLMKVISLTEQFIESRDVSAKIANGKLTKKQTRQTFKN